MYIFLEYIGFELKAWISADRQIEVEALNGKNAENVKCTCAEFHWSLLVEVCYI